VEKENKFHLVKGWLFSKFVKITQMKLIEKPSPAEYPAYAQAYINLLPNDDLIMQHLEDNLQATIALVQSLSADKLLHRYAPDKWTIKEVLVHNIDDERIYAYRAMCFARGEQQELPGFEQEDYARNSGANERDIANIMDEYQAVRRATISLFNGFTDTDLMKTGLANKNRATVRGLLYHLAGHELHHINLIKTRYLTD
jgi:uncharacterized damage-inducible protein DinB